MNFLGLLLLSCEKGDAKLFKDLAKHYAINVKEIEEVWGWGEALAGIGEAWFGIRIPRQGGGNPLFDMMGSMLFGGGGGGGGGNRPGTPSASAGGGQKEGKKMVEGNNSGKNGGGGGGKAAAAAEIPQVMDLD